MKGHGNLFNMATIKIIILQINVRSTVPFRCLSVDDKKYKSWMSRLLKYVSQGTYYIII